MLINSIVGIFSQGICISNFDIEHFKYLTFFCQLYLNKSEKKIKMEVAKSFAEMVTFAKRP